MKLHFFVICLFCALCANEALSQVVFQSSQQRWEVTSVESNDNLTAVFCDITILNNQSGCFDAHEYDKKGSSIYISGVFGTYNLLQSSFEGDYKPWNRYQGFVYWNYYSSHSKGKVSHAIFYFPRIPAGVQTINWHFNGGIANPESNCGKFVCPKFDAKNLQVTNNPNTTPETDWTEQKLRTYWTEHTPTPIEGIYSFISTTNPTYWGRIRHRLAVLKTEEQYQILYIGGANEDIWHTGEVKGTFYPTTTIGLYKIDRWFLENKMLSPADFYLEYHDRHMTLYDSKYYVETQFMKLYPEHDIADAGIPSSSGKQQDNNKVKGNGSGFFVGKNIIATNNHVVQGANRLTVMINTPDGITEYAAKVLCVDKVNDLALISVEDKDFVPYTSLPYTIYPKTIDVGSPIFTMGYPMENIMGSEIKITDGIISSKTGYQGDVVTYQISAPIQPGNSGGPMFDKAGNLVGITSAGIPDANNVGYAIKSGYLNNLIEAAPVTIPNISHNTLTDKDFPTKIKELSPYVVLVLIY